jgi:hypothetical protein
MVEINRINLTITEREDKISFSKYYNQLQTDKTTVCRRYFIICSTFCTGETLTFLSTTSGRLLHITSGCPLLILSENANY